MTESRNCAVTVIASLSFSHRWATSVRNWLSSAVSDRIDRAIASGCQPITATLPISVHDHTNTPASCQRTRLANSPSGGRRRNSGLIWSDENRSHVSVRTAGISAPSGTSTAARTISATGARIATITNSGRLHGFISASGRYSGSSTVPYCVRLWWMVWTPSYMKLGVSSGMPTSRFHAVRKPGSASRWMWVSSWMNISAR